jgi:hypothetical protein
MPDRGDNAPRCSWRNLPPPLICSIIPSTGSLATHRLKRNQQVKTLTHMVGRALTLAFTVSGLVLAQQSTPNPPTDQSTATSGPQSPQWRGLSVKEKLRYDARHLFEIDNLVYAGIGAGFDQLRDRPSEWGEGASGFGERYASHVGQYVIQRSIMFPVQAIDHEDTRYFRSKRASIGGRVGDAFLHTIWRHDDSGGMMPAYSEFIGDYGAAALSRMWWPQRFHTGSAIFIAGSDTVLVDAGINVLHEFTPDLRRWLHLRH